MSWLGWRQTSRAKRAFRNIAGNDRLIDFSEWKGALGIRNDLIARRLFEMVDSDESGYIDLNEFLTFIKTIKHRDIKKRLNFVFRTYDLDGDGFFGRQEIRQIIETSLDEQGLTIADGDMKNLVASFSQQLDIDKDRKVSADDFIAATVEQSSIANQLDHFSAIWLPSPKRPMRGKWRRANFFTSQTPYTTKRHPHALDLALLDRQCSTVLSRC